MESALISIVSVALVIIASVTMMLTSFGSINSIMDSWKKMESGAEEKRRTDITVLPPESYSGGILEVLVTNQGETNLGFFDEWDVISRYQDGQIYYIDYTEDSDPGLNQWSVEGIYLTDNTSISEVFDPDILNPGESAKLKVNLNPEISAGTYGLLITSTYNGVTSQCHIYRSE